MAKTRKTIKQLAEEALQVQDACNLSGVVHSMIHAVQDLWEICREESQSGTSWVNTHPITRAYVSKLISLSGYDIGDKTFEEVYKLVSDSGPKVHDEPLYCSKCGKQLKIRLFAHATETPVRCPNPQCEKYEKDENFFGDDLDKEGGEGA